MNMRKRAFRTRLEVVNFPVLFLTLDHLRLWRTERGRLGGLQISASQRFRFQRLNETPTSGLSRYQRYISCLLSVSKMIQFCGGSPSARSLLSNRNWARAGARMVTGI